MQFQTFGPVAFQPSTERQNRWRSAFWEEMSTYCGKYDLNNELQNCIGCYAFGMQTKQSLKIWYVGQTLAKDGFRSEIFQTHKVNHYTRVAAERCGQPVMFLFPLMTQAGKFSKDRSSSADTIDWLERTLIAMSLKKNPELANVKETRFQRGIWVYGLLGEQPAGRPFPERKAVRQAFGLEK